MSRIWNSREELGEFYTLSVIRSGKLCVAFANPLLFARRRLSLILALPGYWPTATVSEGQPTIGPAAVTLETAPGDQVGNFYAEGLDTD
jgi:hypothetical protein